MKTVKPPKNVAPPCKYCSTCSLWIDYFNGEISEMVLQHKCDECHYHNRERQQYDFEESVIVFMEEIIKHIQNTPEIPPLPKHSEMVISEAINYAKQVHQSKKY